MSKVDDELTRRLRRAERPVDVDAVFEGLERRRSHRERVRRVQAALLAFAVLAATVGGFVGLSRVFRDGQAAGPGRSDGRIVFGRVQLKLFPGGASSGHDFEIWSMAADGSDLRPVYTDQGSATTPAWSPDGSRVAFLDRARGTQDLGTLRLLVSEADGSDLTLIAEGLTDPAVRALAWSPDGAHVAVLDTKAHHLGAFDEFGLPLAEIAVYTLDGTREGLVDVPGSAGGFAWFPDGQGFVVTRINQQGNVDLVSIDLQGQVLGVLAEDVALFSPAWSPDGSRIAFMRDEQLIGGVDVRVEDIWTVNTDGTGERRLTTDGGRKPSLAWAPDGARIIYSSQTPDRCDIVSIGSDGSGRTVVADRSMMGGCAQQVSVQPGVSSTTRSPSPDASPNTDDARDIGLGFPLCHIQRLGDIDWYGDGTSGTAWTGTPLTDGGRCPSSLDASYIVAVDLDGDGTAESAGQPLSGSCLLCRPFDSTDLNGDGVLELVVLDEASSTPSYSLYEVSVPTSERSPGVYALFVEPPGAPQMNLDVGEPVRFIVGGDEGFSASLRCEEGNGSPILAYTWVRGAVDANTDLDVDVTRLRLQQGGSFRILSIDAFSVSRDTKIPDLITTRPACGVDFHPAA
jgi:Tol biopolymer transport system component